MGVGWGGGAGFWFRGRFGGCTRAVPEKIEKLSSSLTLPEPYRYFFPHRDWDLNRETWPIFFFLLVKYMLSSHLNLFLFLVFCITASHLLDFNCNQGYFTDL